MHNKIWFALLTSQNLLLTFSGNAGGRIRVLIHPWGLDFSGLEALWNRFFETYVTTSPYFPPFCIEWRSRPASVAYIEDANMAASWDIVRMVYIEGEQRGQHALSRTTLDDLN